MPRKQREKSTSPVRPKGSSSELPPPPGSATAKKKTQDAAKAPSFDPTSLVPIACLYGWSRLGLDVSYETEEGLANIFMIRCIFYGVVALCFCVAVFLWHRISNVKADTTLIEVITPKTLAEPEKKEKMTVTQYDQAQLRKLAGSIIMPLLIISLMHFKWQFIRPLVLQAIMMPMNLSKSQLVKIHMLGQKAEGDLERPWTPPKSPFAALFDGEAKQEKAKAKKAAKKDKKNK